MKKILLLLLLAINIPTIANAAYTVHIGLEPQHIFFIDKESEDGGNNEEVIDSEIISFNAHTNTISRGDYVLLNWELKNAVSATLNGASFNIRDTQKRVYPSQVGTVNYVLEITDASGTKKSKTQSINVSDLNIITSFIVDKDKVSTNATLLKFTWNMPKPVTLKLKSNRGFSQVVNVNLKTASYVINNPVGETEYTLEATNTAGELFTKSVTVSAYPIPVITSLSFPSNIWMGQTYAIHWTGVDSLRYTINSSTSNTGVYVYRDQDVESGITATSCKDQHPDCAGTSYYIELRAYNEAGYTVNLRKNIVIERNPATSYAMVNGVQLTNTLQPSAPLSITIYGNPEGMVLKSSQSATAPEIAFPDYAPSVEGTYKYYPAICKTVNNERRCSKPVVATVIVKN